MARTMTALYGVHRQLDWKAGIWSGLIAGLVTAGAYFGFRHMDDHA